MKFIKRFIILNFILIFIFFVALMAFVLINNKRAAKKRMPSEFSPWSLLDYINLRPQKAPFPGLPAKKNPTEMKFWKYYHFSFSNYTLFTQAIKTNSGNIAAALFVPNSINKNRQKLAQSAPVLFIHGYLDHVALNSPLIEELLSKGKVVIAIDLPGHGRSDGFRFNIDQFTRYGEVLNEIIDYYSPHFNQKITLLGHSTGCTAILQYIENKEPTEIQQIILAAPLIRTHFWKILRSVRFVSKKWLPSIPRYYSGSSTDKQYLNKVKHEDFLGSKTVPANWSDANALWVKQFHSNLNSDLLNNKKIPPITILQGKKDIVIDYPYNIKIILKKYPQAHLIYIKNCRHGLFHEKPKNKRKVFQLIIKILNNSL